VRIGMTWGLNTVFCAAQASVKAQVQIGGGSLVLVLVIVLEKPAPGKQTEDEEDVMATACCGAALEAFSSHEVWLAFTRHSECARFHGFLHSGIGDEQS